MSVLIYLVICWVTVPQGSDLERAVANPIVRVLYGVAVITFLMSFVAFKQLSSSRGGSGVPLHRALMVRWALLEAVTIFGLIAAFIVGSREVIVPPLVVSVIGFVLSFPSESFLRDRAPGE